MARRKLKPVTFTVAGRGYFPKDMLRYDGCRAASPEDQAKIDWDPEKDQAPKGTSLLYRRNVTLVVDEPPHRKWEPTYGRWESFSWRVELLGL